MGLKQSVTVEEVIDFLNEMYEIDKEAISMLVYNRVICNEDLAMHPTVQVNYDPVNNFFKVGLLGILNGLFGTDENGTGYLCVNVDKKTGEILEFGKIE